jgi:D-amino-acid dehydrogenase
LRELRRDHALAFDDLKRGTLKIFRSDQTLQTALDVSRNLEPFGLTATLVSGRDLSRIEPCLSPIQNELAGAVFYPDDESGDAHLFCRAMARTIGELGGEFRYGAAVSSIDVRGGKVRGVRLADEILDAETVVVAAGVSSPALVGRLGVDLAIKPVKGYSMTYEVATDTPMPRVPVIDDAYHAAVTPLGSRLRVAGTAEFAGRNLTLDQTRVGNLSRFFADLYPELADARTLATGKPWAGLRPVAADGRPYIGPAAVEGLWVNSGHGHLGWTMAAGSARLLVDLMTGQAPALDPADYALAR